MCLSDFDEAANADEADTANIVDTLAEIRRRVGAAAEARALAERALRGAPSGAHVGARVVRGAFRATLAKALLDAGDGDRARAERDEALALLEGTSAQASRIARELRRQFEAAVSGAPT